MRSFLKRFITRFFKSYSVKEYNYALFALVLILTMVGLAVIGSANPDARAKQIIGMILGIAALLFLSVTDYMWIQDLHWVLYIALISILIFVKLFGENYNGAKRWIAIGSFTFQPSELAKIIMIIWAARFIMNHRKMINKPSVLLQYFGFAAIPLALIYMQPDMSTTISIGIVLLVILFMGGISYRYIVAAAAIAVPLLVIFLSIVVQPDQKLIKSYQQDRILAWLEPEKYSTSDGWQQQNSIMAIGSGQLSGKGLNNETADSVKNGNYIVEPETDFIFAIIGEELGFIGCCAVIGLLAGIVFLIIRTGTLARDIGGQLLCYGIASQIAFQGFMNISVATGLAPNTGIPLPFVSAGLTSLVSLYAGIGLVLNVGLQKNYISRTGGELATW